MVGFRDLVGVGIAPVSKKSAVNGPNEPEQSDTTRIGSHFFILNHVNIYHDMRA